MVDAKLNDQSLRSTKLIGTPDPVVCQRSFLYRDVIHFDLERRDAIKLIRAVFQQRHQMFVSRLLLISALLPIVGLGCARVPEQAAHSTTDDLATYDTHATHDAKVEQYRRDYGNCLTQRRATYRRWRETVEVPARNNVTESQWKDFQATVETKCAESGDSGSPSISECRSLLLDEFLSKISDGYESLNRYEARHGVGPPPTYPEYNLAPSPPTDHEIEYEQAKKECAEKMENGSR